MTNITELKEKLIDKVKTQSGTYQDQKTITALLSIIEEMQDGFSKIDNSSDCKFALEITDETIIATEIKLKELCENQSQK